MYQTRNQVSPRIPIARKGTKYVVAPLSNKNNSVPVLIAVRDMLHLAKTAKEVKKMINQKLLKLNNKIIKDYRESIMLFNIFEADKHYILTLSPAKKFAFEPSNSPVRLCRVSNKKLLNNNVIQLNLHDGTNVISKSKINVGDSVYLDSEGKIKSHIAFEKGAKVFIFSGKYAGKHGSIKAVEGNKVSVSFTKEGSAVLNKSQLIVM